MYRHNIKLTPIFKSGNFVPKTVFTHAAIATLSSNDVPYGLIEDGALVLDGAEIVWCGDTHALPAKFKSAPSENLEGRLVTPGLIDCHTHLIHGGNRAQEFELRLGGATYEEIARAGGGIVSTVTATRDASEEALLTNALTHIDSLIEEGVTSVEIKSGYGLNQDTEIKMLRVARKIPMLRPIHVSTTYLGAHALPLEYKDRADSYIDVVCIPTLHNAHALGLVDAVDGFCETIGFTPAQIRRVFDAARAIDLPVKLHAEQLSNLGGAQLAAEFSGLSADHLEYLDENGAEAMAKAGTVAVLLPGAYYTLRDETPPPIELFRKHNVPMAVATDCNPGSSPLSSLLTAMNMACTLFRLTPQEALRGATQNAATALGLSDRGRIAPGLRADLAIWDVSHPAELSYRIGYNPLYRRIFGGQS